MTTPVVLRRRAQKDIEAGFAWYERQRAGLGRSFAAEIQKVLDLIVVSPEAHAVHFRDARRALVKRFPYSALNRIEPHRLVVLAVFHNKRDPGHWQSRV